jgi:hypothetical protein
MHSTIARMNPRMPPVLPHGFETTGSPKTGGVIASKCSNMAAALTGVWQVQLRRFPDLCPLLPAPAVTKRGFSPREATMMQHDTEATEAVRNEPGSRDQEASPSPPSATLNLLPTPIQPLITSMEPLLEQPEQLKPPQTAPSELDHSHSGSRAVPLVTDYPVRSAIRPDPRVQTQRSSR